MTNRTNPNKIRTKCPECGSTLKCEDGRIFCTQDMFIEEYPNLFTKWDAMSDSNLTKTLDQASYKLYDMYHRWKHIDKETGDRTEFCCTYDYNETFNPMTKSETILPDPAQTKIAEFILKRKLNEHEYYGIRRVPLLDPEGVLYYGQVQQLVYPRDYMAEGRDMDENTDYTNMPVVFRWEDLE